MPEDPKQTLFRRVSENLCDGLFLTSNYAIVNTQTFTHQCGDLSKIVCYSILGTRATSKLVVEEKKTTRDSYVTPSGLHPLLELVDQTVGRSIVSSHWSGVVQLLTDSLGENLTQLNTPLVERVDVPDGTLGEGHVLIVCD